jgi:hypothetical protein
MFTRSDKMNATGLSYDDGTKASIILFLVQEYIVKNKQDNGD